MNTTIYYFSGTGNSLMAAKELAENIGNTHVMPAAKILENKNIADYSDSIGFVFPVYCWGPPLIISELIKKIQISNKGAYVFAVATYGGSAGNALGMVNTLLKNKGYSLSAGFSLKMPANYTPLYGAPSDDKIKKLLEQNTNRIKDIAKLIKVKSAQKFEKGNFFINLLGSLLYPAFIKNIPASDSKFYADEKCNLCGVCVKICPKNNISIENNKVIWHHKCEQCLACLQWCPVEAVQYGKSTKNRKRYRNPNISIDELIEQK